MAVGCDLAWSNCKSCSATSAGRRLALHQDHRCGVGAYTLVQAFEVWALHTKHLCVLSQDSTVTVAVMPLGKNLQSQFGLSSIERGAQSLEHLKRLLVV